MSIDRRKNRIVAALGMVALAAFLSVTSALAGKPGGGVPVPVPPAPGTIYFYQRQGPDMSMNGDGSGKRTVPVTLVPSYQTHGGTRWTLQGDYVDGPLDPSGNPPYELFARDHRTGWWYQLTSDPDIHWYYWDLPAWGRDDSFVSFGGLQSTPAGVVGGLFVVPIDWSTGVPVAGKPTLVLPVDVEVSPAWWAWSVPSLHGHNWSPTGSEVVYETREGGSVPLSVASFSGGGVSTRPLTTGEKPEWSPDGSRVAFDRGEIWTIRRDGTGALRLTQSSATKADQRRQYHPSWSPDGDYVAFTDVVTKVSTSTSTYSIGRIPSGGGGAVNLTGDVANALDPNWRP
jgi:hypothetical protein